jgi:hypothetical protein
MRSVQKVTTVCVLLSQYTRSRDQWITDPLVTTYHLSDWDICPSHTWYVRFQGRTYQASVFTPDDAPCLHVRRETLCPAARELKENALRVQKMASTTSSQTAGNVFPIHHSAPDLAPSDFNSLHHWRSTSKENSSNVMMWWKTIRVFISPLWE